MEEEEIKLQLDQLLEEKNSPSFVSKFEDVNIVAGNQFYSQLNYYDPNGDLTSFSI